MRAILLTFLILSTGVEPLLAKGCIRGAVVGGVAGHFGQWPEQGVDDIEDVRSRVDQDVRPMRAAASVVAHGTGT